MKESKRSEKFKRMRKNVTFDSAANRLINSNYRKFMEDLNSKHIANEQAKLRSKSRDYVSNRGYNPNFPMEKMSSDKGTDNNITDGHIPEINPSGLNELNDDMIAKVTRGSRTSGNHPLADLSNEDEST